jgi:Lrp/AsnC family leucine-responsive transcriptional regulator
MTDKLDAYDRKIMKILAANGRIPWRELADKVGLSLTPTLRRVRRLEKSGYIERYTIAMSANKMIGAISVMMSITTDQQSAEAFAKFENKICEIDEVIYCALQIGSANYSVHIVAKDMADFQKLYMDISALPHVKLIQSNFILKVIRRLPMLPPITGE